MNSLVKPAFAAALAAVASVAAAGELKEHLWFFADFDRPAMLDGKALEQQLSPIGECEGRYGRGYFFHGSSRNLLPPMKEYLSAKESFTLEKGAEAPKTNPKGNLEFARGIFRTAPVPAEIHYSYVRPFAGATWSFFVKGAKGAKIGLSVRLSAATAEGIEEGKRKNKYTEDKAVKETSETKTYELTGEWQRVWATAVADNRISAGRRTHLRVASTGLVEMNRFQYEPRGYYPEIGEMAPGVWVDGGEKEDRQLLKVADPAALAGFPSAKGACSAWVRAADAPKAMAPVWGYNEQWATQRGFSLERLWTAGDAFAYGKGGLTDAGWHHFAASWDGTTIKIWRDGKEIASAPQKTTYGGSGKPRTLRVGSFGTDERCAEAELDEIAIFSRPITGEEAQALASARTGLLGDGSAMVATAVEIPVFARNQENAAIRRRIYAPKAGTYVAEGAVGGLPLKAEKFVFAKGWNEFAVPFDPALFRPGEYPYAYGLKDGAGKAVYSAAGTLTVTPRAERNGFMVHAWGGYGHGSIGFMKKFGINCVMTYQDIPRIRELAQNGIFSCVRYDNSVRFKDKPFTADAIAAAAARDFGPLKGCHWWPMTLANTEVYGDSTLERSLKTPGFAGLAEKELGIKPDWSVKFNPTEILWKKIGVEPPRGVVAEEPAAIKSMRWYNSKGMPEIRITAATVPAVRKVDPDNVVWSEPTFSAGLAESCDMIAGWAYAPRNWRVLSELYGQASVARSAGCPFMPTIEPKYEKLKGLNGEAVCPSVDDLKVKAFLAIAATPAENLSVFNEVAYERGTKREDGHVAEPDGAERFGEFMRGRFMPAAELLRGIPNDTAPVALLSSYTAVVGGGFWWGYHHFHEAIKDGLVRDGLPVDVLDEKAVESGALEKYSVVVAPMQNLVLKRVHDAHRKAALGGTVTVLDGHAQVDYPNAVRIADLKYNSGLVNAPGGLEKMYSPLGEWIKGRKSELRERRFAWSETDGSASHTFCKTWKGVRYVAVVNDLRKEDRGMFANVMTNGWYRPFGAPQRIATRFAVPEGTEVFEFNSGGKRHKVRGGVLELDYAPAETKVFCVYPAAPAKMALAKDGEFRAGGKARIKVEVKDGNGRPAAGRQIVAFELRRPDGTLADESGRYAVEDGRCEIAVRFAHDDVRGTFFKRWKAKAVDLATGVEDGLSFRLE